MYNMCLKSITNIKKLYLIIHNEEKQTCENFSTYKKAK